MGFSEAMLSRLYLDNNRNNDDYNDYDDIYDGNDDSIDDRTFEHPLMVADLSPTKNLIL